MTVGELCQRMDSRELSEWIAYDKYFEPIGDAWLQTAFTTSAVISTVAGRRAPKPQDLVPVDKRCPMHPSQIEAELRRMHADMNGG